MDTVITILVGVLLFSVIIVFHELGHLIVAKKNGIRVDEFMVGFGPKIFSFKKGETVYAFRLFLIGGACQMLGENEESNDERAFCNKGIWARFSTVFAGPFFNFLLAFLFSAIIIGIIGYDETAVTRVEKDSPADTTVFVNVDDPNDTVTGMKAGDIIIKYEGKSYPVARELTYHFLLDRMEGTPIDVVFERDGKEYSGTIVPKLFRKYQFGFVYTATVDEDGGCKINEVSEDGVFEAAGIKNGDLIKKINDTEIGSGKDLSEYLEANPLDGSPVTLLVDHKGTEKEYTLTPSYTESYISPKYMANSVGIYIDHNESRVSANPFEVLKYSLYEVKLQIQTVFKALGKLVTGQLSLKNNVGGPVRVVSELGNTIEESKKDGFLYIMLNLLNYAVLLSANLGVMNLLPLPALDGGRLIFIIVELIRRKPVPKEKEGLVHAIGMVFFLVLMVIVLFNDIRYVFF